jgi:hypothetical protein
MTAYPIKFEPEDEANRDVHTEHCCLTHGCCYRNDECPVATGKKRQSHPCEMCDGGPYGSPFSQVSRYAWRVDIVGDRLRATYVGYYPPDSEVEYCVTGRTADEVVVQVEADLVDGDFLALMRLGIALGKAELEMAP